MLTGEHGDADNRGERMTEAGCDLVVRQGIARAIHDLLLADRPRRLPTAPARAAGTLRSPTSLAGLRNPGLCDE